MIVPIVIGCILFGVLLILGINKKIIRLFKYSPIEYKGLSPIETEFVRLVNENRKNLKLNLLIPEKLACEVCTKRVEDDVKEGVLGSHYYWATMISDAKVNNDSGTHIVANNYATALALFNGYMGSPRHKGALEHKDRTHIGTSFIQMRNHTILTKYN